MSIAYVALAARTLGAEAFGALVLLNSLVLSLAQLARFQTWQAIMRFGAEHLERGETARFRGLLVFALRLDVAAAVLAFAVFLAGFDHLASFFNLPVAIRADGRYYGAVMFFIIISSTPLGVMRLFDRHDLVSWHTVVEPFVRVVGAAWCFATEAGLTAFVAVWFVSTAIGRVVAGAFAFGLLRDRALLPRLADHVGRDLGLPRGSWRFVFGTHLTSSLNLGNTQLGTLLAGWLLGPVGAAHFRIARQFANVLVKPSSKLLVPAIFTDMTELTARGDDATRRHVVIRSMLAAGAVAGAVFLLLAAGGEWLLALVFGDPYRPVYPAMLWLAAAGLLTVMLFPIEPLLISAGRIRAVVIARGVALAVYLVAFHRLVLGYGLVGAGMATALAAAVTAALLWLFGARLLRTTAGAPPVTS